MGYYRNIILKIAFQPHKKNPGFLVHMLIDINYVSTIFVDKSGYGTYYPGLIGTMDKQGRFQSVLFWGKIRISKMICFHCWIFL